MPTEINEGQLSLNIHA